MKGCGGGLVVSALANCYEVPSSNHPSLYMFPHVIVQKDENKWKRGQAWPILKTSNKKHESYQWGPIILHLEIPIGAKERSSEQWSTCNLAHVRNGFNSEPQLSPQETED